MNSPASWGASRVALHGSLDCPWSSRRNLSSRCGANASGLIRPDGCRGAFGCRRPRCSRRRRPAPTPWSCRCRLRMRSFFRLLKVDSATALSQQLPRRLMLGCRLCSRQKRLKSSLPYWLAWSACTMTCSAGLRRHTAISKASRASSRLSVGFIDQPTTLRECRSTTAATYNHPCQVRM